MQQSITTFSGYTHICVSSLSHTHAHTLSLSHTAVNSCLLLQSINRYRDHQHAVEFSRRFFAVRFFMVLNFTRSKNVQFVIWKLFSDNVRWLMITTTMIMIIMIIVLLLLQLQLIIRLLIIMIIIMVMIIIIIIIIPLSAGWPTPFEQSSGRDWHPVHVPAGLLHPDQHYHSNALRSALNFLSNFYIFIY